MNRLARTLLSTLVAACVVLTPTAAGAGNENIVVAVNRTDGVALARAGVDVQTVRSGHVLEENRAYAVTASCTGCQTLAVAFQLVIATKPVKELAPQNEAVATNYECDGCVTWAAAKQIVLETGGPAAVTEAGQARLQAVEDGLRALAADMPTMTLVDLQAAVEAAFQEFLAVAQTEVVRTDTGRRDATIVATRSS